MCHLHVRIPISIQYLDNIREGRSLAGKCQADKIHKTQNGMPPNHSGPSKWSSWAKCFANLRIMDNGLWTTSGPLVALRRDGLMQIHQINDRIHLHYCEAATNWSDFRHEEVWATWRPCDICTSAHLHYNSLPLTYYRVITTSILHLCTLSNCQLSNQRNNFKENLCYSRDVDQLWNSWRSSVASSAISFGVLSLRSSSGLGWDSASLRQKRENLQRSAAALIMAAARLMSTLVQSGPEDNANNGIKLNIADHSSLSTRALQEPYAAHTLQYEVQEFNFSQGRWNRKSKRLKKNSHHRNVKEPRQSQHWVQLQHLE